MASRPEYDLIVIGSGAGGGVGASIAAAWGKRVAIVEKEAWGGECPNFGCVPTKALLYAADLYNTARSAPEYGISSGEVKADFAKIQRWKDLVLSRTGAAQGSRAFTSEGIDVLKGNAEFTSPHQLAIGDRTYSARHFLIATGTVDFIPPIPGLVEVGFMTFRQAIEITTPPKSLFIIGGGPIGCEFAQLFSSFGTKVHIADTLPRLLGREDDSIGDLVGAIYADRGLNILTESLVTKVGREGGRKVVHYRHKNQDHQVAVDEILVASGKKPQLQIGLEAAGVKTDQRGIVINHWLQTSVKHIFAAGDVIGPFQFTHTAEYQSQLAVNNMYRRRIAPNYAAIPRCIFTDPEVASVGISEQTARAKKLKIKIGAVPIGVLGRANTADTPNGFVKVITNRSGVLIGAAIVSPRAGEMIHELALAIKLRASAADVAQTVHAFPTYSEAVKMACQMAAG